MSISGRMHEANEACFASVRGEVRTLFGALCRNKSADLVMTGRKVQCFFVRCNAGEGVPVLNGEAVCVLALYFRFPRAILCL